MPALAERTSLSPTVAANAASLFGSPSVLAAVCRSVSLLLIVPRAEILAEKEDSFWFNTVRGRRSISISLVTMLLESSPDPMPSDEMVPVAMV